MSIIHTIIITFTLLAISFDSNSSDKVPTDAELKAHLLSKSSDFETLISILNKTEYSNVLWIENGPLNARVGNNKNAVWDKSPNLDGFVNKAIELGLKSLFLGVDDFGNWKISTGTEVIFLNGDPSRGTAVTKTVKKSYWYGAQPKYSICTPQIIGGAVTGACYTPLSTNWFLFKYWYTHDPTIEQT